MFIIPGDVLIVVLIVVSFDVNFVFELDFHDPTTSLSVCDFTKE